jgi:formate hydrogenlyase subunit 3/multisubunit Na+/H+ antiporter MnhD subunit
MVGFAILIAFISRWYLIPAMEAAQNATGVEKRQLVAHSRLLLAVVLFILVAGILLTFRFGRYFVPRAGEKARPTEYPDAWAESAKRVSVPPRESQDE